MFDSLKDHPFAVEAFFEKSIVLTFAVPKKDVLPLLPECLSPDTFEDQYAFIAVALVKTKKLRPKGFPEFMGNDFILTGYRIFVRYTSNAGKRLRGLYIIRSETDRKKMEFFGNIFTHYNYSTTDISLQQTGPEVIISSEKSKFRLSISEDPSAVLPLTSPFKDWKEARRYAGPLPFTFTYNERKKEVLIIEGVRSDWNPTPVQVNSFSLPYLDSLQIPDLRLANAFVINNVPYYWKKGRKEIWQQ